MQMTAGSPFLMSSYIMQQKKRIMFVSKYFLIFIRYTFSFNCNLSARTGQEGISAATGPNSPQLMRFDINQKKEGKGWKCAAQRRMKRNFKAKKKTHDCKRSPSQPVNGANTFCDSKPSVPSAVYAITICLFSQ